MTDEAISRRKILTAAIAGAAATTTLVAAEPAEAGRYASALDHLYAAHRQLKHARRHAGGHRAHALRLVERAIAETKRARKKANW